MIPLDRFVLLYEWERPGHGPNPTKVVHSAVRLSQIEAFAEAYNVTEKVILTSCSHPEGEYHLDSKNPKEAVLGWARLVAFGWPGRQSPLIEMWDLEWIGSRKIWGADENQNG